MLKALLTIHLATVASNDVPFDLDDGERWESVLDFVQGSSTDTLSSTDDTILSALLSWVPY